jgi:hypothetical protein
MWRKFIWCLFDNLDMKNIEYIALNEATQNKLICKKLDASSNRQGS